MPEITPVNFHVRVDPIKHESFVSSQRDTYDEVGTVVSFDQRIGSKNPIHVGDRVYFDSWLAKRYPIEGTEEFFWLVDWRNISAIVYVEQPIPKQ